MPKAPKVNAIISLNLVSRVLVYVIHDVTQHTFQNAEMRHGVYVYEGKGSTNAHIS